MLRFDAEKTYLVEFWDAHLRDPKYFQWLRDPDVMAPIGRIEYLMPMEFSAVEEYVKGLMASPNDCLFALYAKEGERFVGTVKVGHIDWRSGVCDLGIMIGDREVGGKGLGTDALRRACQYAFDELGMQKIGAGGIASNQGMCRCFERLGFKDEGRRRRHVSMRGQLEDIQLYGLLKSEVSW